MPTGTERSSMFYVQRSCVADWDCRTVNHLQAVPANSMTTFNSRTKCERTMNALIIRIVRTRCDHLTFLTHEDSIERIDIQIESTRNAGDHPKKPTQPSRDTHASKIIFQIYVLLAAMQTKTRRGGMQAWSGVKLCERDAAEGAVPSPNMDKQMCPLLYLHSALVCGRWKAPREPRAQRRLAIVGDARTLTREGG